MENVNINKNKNHSRVSVSGISSLLKMKADETPDTNPRGWHQAFTLIELLVVVLIIGILSAIALPQYRKAVERSRAAEGELMLRTLRDAQARCFLANGEVGKCMQGEPGDNLFANMDISLGELVDDPYEMGCEKCALQSNYFVYTVDGEFIDAMRIENGEAIYALETTAYPDTWCTNRIVCVWDDTYCKDIGYTQKDSHSRWLKP